MQNSMFRDILSERLERSLDNEVQQKRDIQVNPKHLSSSSSFLVSLFVVCFEFTEYFALYYEIL